MSNGKCKLFMAALSSAVLLALAMWGWRQGSRPASAPVSPMTNASRATTNVASDQQSTSGLGEKLRDAAAALRAARGTGSAREQLIRLRQALAAVPLEEAAAVIRQFLDGKADAPTGQGFRPSGKGSLAEAPTLRTFLLDYLGQIDPAAAAAYAREILASSDSPDEWAVALRNLAVGDTTAAGRELLEQKTGELLRNEAWQQDPSAGYLEAFDVAVYLGGTNLVSPLAELARKQDNSAVAHAAYLALDRLVINDPAELLAALEASPELMQGREGTRANYFARADVRDPQQRQVLENYLLDSRISATELAQFAGLYPSAN